MLYLNFISAFNFNSSKNIQFVTQKIILFRFIIEKKKIFFLTLFTIIFHVSESHIFLYISASIFFNYNIPNIFIIFVEPSIFTFPCE